jgi:FKBP-type peptidyl-prolyl cis-trans isomerase 2
MTFEEFIQLIAPKIGPNATFDISRDARFKALENILMEKGVASKEEMEAETEKCFGEMAENILKMPPIPLQKKDEQPQQDK